MGTLCRKTAKVPKSNPGLIQVPIRYCWSCGMGMVVGLAVCGQATGASSANSSQHARIQQRLERIRPRVCAALSSRSPARAYKRDAIS